MNYTRGLQNYICDFDESLWGRKDRWRDSEGWGPIRRLESKKYLEKAGLEQGQGDRQVGSEPLCRDKPGPVLVKLSVHDVLTITEGTR